MKKKIIPSLFLTGTIVLATVASSLAQSSPSGTIDSGNGPGSSNGPDGYECHIQACEYVEWQENNFPSGPNQSEENNEATYEAAWNACMGN